MLVFGGREFDRGIHWRNSKRSWTFQMADSAPQTTEHESRNADSTNQFRQYKILCKSQSPVSPISKLSHLFEGCEFNGWFPCHISRITSLQLISGFWPDLSDIGNGINSQCGEDYLTKPKATVKVTHAFFHISKCSEPLKACNEKEWYRDGDTDKDRRQKLLCHRDYKHVSPV